MIAGGPISSMPVSGDVPSGAAPPTPAAKITSLGLSATPFAYRTIQPKTEAPAPSFSNMFRNTTARGVLAGATSGIR